jgi:hypothetical protein
MPFLQAGFNAHNTKTGIRGWTRNAAGNRHGFAPAELRRFDCGDYFWLGDGPRGAFLRWGEQIVLGSWYEFTLPHEHQWNLPQCDLDTRRERGRWVRGEWVDPPA